MHHEMMRSSPPIFTALEPPSFLEVANLEPLLAAPEAELPDLARHWAEAVWEAWRPHHTQVRAWNLALVPHRVR